MKILEINNFHYRRGGSESVYFNTSQILEQNGHQVISLSLQHPKNIKSLWQKYFISNPNYLESSFLNKLRSVKKFIYSSEAKANITELIKNEKPDIAHLHLFYGGLTSSILSVLKKFNIPVVATIHDYKLLCPVYTLLTPNNNICEKCISGNYLNCIVGSCNKNNLFFSIIMAVESYFRDYFYAPNKYINKFIFISKFALNKHLENKPIFRNKAEQLYNFYPYLSNNSPNHHKGDYFLYYGRLSHEKGLKTLLDTWKNLSNLKLKIAGDGPLKEFVQKEITKNINIEYLGFQTGEELNKIISNASFIIVPSEWYENNPMTIIEAYSFGKPVIGANIGGIPEIVQHNKTGFLFEPANSKDLEKYITKAKNMTESQYIVFSKNSRKFSEENFNKEEHYNKLIKIFESLVH